MIILLLLLLLPLPIYEGETEKEESEKDKDNGKETKRDPESSTVCSSIWDDLVKKGVYHNWYHPESLMVCHRIGMAL